MMRSLTLCLLLFCGFLFHDATARADWVEMGAQVKCDSAAATFRILPYWDSSSGKAKVEPGFQVLKPGVSTLSCRFGKRSLRVQVAVIEPNARHCGGSGSAVIRSAAIDNVELINDSIAIDDDCENDKPVIDIKLHYAGGIATLTQCTGSSDDLLADRKPASDGCKTATVELDRLSAEYAKIDHDLADPAVQQAQSAARLPPSEDMAKIYTALADPTGTPLCAHWAGEYDGKNARYARIAGRDGDRVYIRAANPQICRRADDDGCGEKAYVIPGDRVAVNFICGAWANVVYEPRIKATPATAGWVETNRLYAVDPRQDMQPVSPDALAVTPLFAAVWKGDLDAAAKLLDAATPASRKDEVPQALGLAATIGDLEMLNMMLSKGVGPDDRDTGDQEKMTALMRVAQTKGVTSSASTGPGRDGPRSADAAAVAKRLIAADADIQAQDEWGATALFHAADSNNIRVARLLLDAGADPNFVAGKGEELGYTPLMRAVTAYGRTYDPSLIQLLLERGAKADFREGGDPQVIPTYPTYAGETALTVSARLGYMTIVRLLLEQGADPVRPRVDGISPADIAEQNQHPEIAALIREYAAKQQ